MQHRISAGAFVQEGDRLLLVRHRKEGAYDFWVAPGGGVEGCETLAAAAVREVKEETGLDIVTDRLLYIEEFFSSHTRYCKFWFLATSASGTLAPRPGAAHSEHIVAAAWHSRREIQSLKVFPAVLQGSFWSDRDRPGPIHLGPYAVEME